MKITLLLLAMTLIAIKSFPHENDGLYISSVSYKSLVSKKTSRNISVVPSVKSQLGYGNFLGSKDPPKTGPGWHSYDVNNDSFFKGFQYGVSVGNSLVLRNKNTYNNTYNSSYIQFLSTIRRKSSE